MHQYQIIAHFKSTVLELQSCECSDDSTTPRLTVRRHLSILHQFKRICTSRLATKLLTGNIRRMTRDFFFFVVWRSDRIWWTSLSDSTEKQNKTKIRKKAQTKTLKDRLASTTKSFTDILSSDEDHVVCSAVECLEAPLLFSFWCSQLGHFFLQGNINIFFFSLLFFTAAPRIFLKLWARIKSTFLSYMHTAKHRGYAGQCHSYFVCCLNTS